MNRNPSTTIEDPGRIAEGAAWAIPRGSGGRRAMRATASTRRGLSLRGTLRSVPGRTHSVTSHSGLRTKPSKTTRNDHALSLTLGVDSCR